MHCEHPFRKIKLGVVTLNLYKKTNLHLRNINQILKLSYFSKILVFGDVPPLVNIFSKTIFHYIFLIKGALFLGGVFFFSLREMDKEQLISYVLSNYRKNGNNTTKFLS